MGIIVAGVSGYNPKWSIWGLDLSSHIDTVYTDFDEGDTYVAGAMDEYTKGSEIWIGCYDRVLCFNKETGVFIASINITPDGEYWEMTHIFIDEADDMMYVGSDDGNIYKINLLTRTVVSSVAVQNGLTAKALALINNSPTHCLYVITSGREVQKFSLPDLSYVMTHDFGTGAGFSLNCADVNNNERYVYFTRDRGGLIQAAIVRIDATTDSITTVEAPGIGVYSFHDCTVDSAGNVYVFGAIAAGDLIRKYDKDLSFILESSVYQTPVKNVNDMDFDSNNSFLYVLSGDDATIRKFNASTLEVVATGSGSNIWSLRVAEFPTLPISSILMYKFRPVINV